MRKYLNCRGKLGGGANCCEFGLIPRRQGDLSQNFILNPRKTQESRSLDNFMGGRQRLKHGQGRMRLGGEGLDWPAIRHASERGYYLQTKGLGNERGKGIRFSSAL